MGKESKTILELDKFQNGPMETDEFPIARPGTDSDNKCSIGDIISLNKETNELTIFGNITIDISSLLKTYFTITLNGDSHITGFQFNGNEITDNVIESKTSTLSGEITAIVDDNYQISAWTLDGQSSGNNNPLSINNISSNTVINATSVGRPCTVIMSSDGNGLAEISPISVDNKYSFGSTITINVTPNTNYIVDKFVDSNNNTVNVTKSGNNYTYVVNGDINITAKFKLNSHSVKATVRPNNSGSVAITYNGQLQPNPATITHGEMVTLVATANEYYGFSRWSDGEPNASREETVNENKEFVAEFIPSGSPDFYYGAVTPNAISGKAYDKNGLIDELTPGWIMGNNSFESEQMTINAGEKMIVLYNNEKVSPFKLLIGDDLTRDEGHDEFGSDEFTSQNFVFGTVSDDITYSSFEDHFPLGVGETQYFKITFHKEINSIT